MKWDTVKPLIEGMNAEMLALRERKMSDYASGADCHSNFKRVAAACDALGIDVGDPEQLCLFFVIHKIARIVNLAEKPTGAACEPVHDSYADALNYLHLGREIYLESSGQVVETPLG